VNFNFLKKRPFIHEAIFLQKPQSGLTSRC
jgi:hypothetical protein